MTRVTSYVHCSNGVFAVCPDCGKTMANNFEFWLCLFGCGLKIRRDWKAARKAARSR